MSNASLILPQIGILAESAAALVAEAGENRARINALNKAIHHLHAGVEPIITFGGFLVESGTRGGVIHRVSSVSGCSCEAATNGARPCWHAALIEVIQHAQQRRIPLSDRLAAARRVSYEKAVADMDELFAA
jgi:hypothetical protein